MFVILNTETGKFVARQGSQHSYTAKLQHARTFPTRAAADADRCPGNEITLSIDEAMTR